MLIILLLLNIIILPHAVVLGASTTRQAVEAAILGEISKDEEAAHKLDELTTGGARQLEGQHLCGNSIENKLVCMPL